MHKFIFLALVFGVVVGAEVVAEAAPCDYRSCRGTLVGSLYAAQNGKVYVSPADGGQNNLSCTLVSNVYVTLSPAHPNFAQIFRMLLEAKLALRPVWIRMQIGSSECNIAYAVLEN